jgi:hypothetical protein
LLYIGKARQGMLNINTSQPRSRTLTERARLYMLGQAQRERDKLIKLIYQKLVKINQIMSSDKIVPEVVQKESNELDMLFQDFMTKHSSCHMLIQAGCEDTVTADISDLNFSADKLGRDVCLSKQRINSWLSQHDTSSVRAKSTEERSMKDPSVPAKTSEV